MRGKRANLQETEVRAVPEPACDSEAVARIRRACKRNVVQELHAFGDRLIGAVCGQIPLGEPDGLHRTLDANHLSLRDGGRESAHGSYRSAQSEK